MRKGLLRPKKGPTELGPSLTGPSPGTRGAGPSSPDKVKLVERGRKARRLRGPKEPGFEAGPEASDDDLWARRRSERIFLHDAAAPPAPRGPAPPPKASRCGKGGALSPRKDARDRKDPRKVSGGGTRRYGMGTLEGQRLDGHPSVLRPLVTFWNVDKGCTWFGPGSGHLSIPSFCGPSL